MKTTTATLLVATLLVATTACREKKTGQDDIITTTYNEPQLQAPIRATSQQTTTTITWDDRTYTATISRTPADSLPKVADEYGQEYVDNAIHLTITRQDQTVFFDHVYTKADFNNILSDDYRHSALLANLRFIEAGSHALTFIASVNYPDGTDDEAALLELTVDRSAHVALRRTDSYDLRGNWDTMEADD